MIVYILPSNLAALDIVCFTACTLPGPARDLDVGWGCFFSFLSAEFFVKAALDWGVGAFLVLREIFPAELTLFD